MRAAASSILIFALTALRSPVSERWGMLKVQFVVAMSKYVPVLGKWVFSCFEKTAKTLSKVARLPAVKTLTKLKT